MKQRIIAIVGASGSGKTTLANKLSKDFGIPTVVSYTTRDMRPGETDGVEHWFVTPDKKPQDIFAYTKFGGYEYWTSLSQLQSLGPIFTYVIDEIGLVNMEKQWGEMFDVTKILIVRHDTQDISMERKQRDNDRMQLSYNYYNAVFTNNGTIQELADNVFSYLNGYPHG